MKWNKLVCSTAIFSMLTAGSAWSAAEKASAMLGDSNTDGKLAAAEMKVERVGFHATMDINKDGKVTVNEFVVTMEKNFDAKDSNKDGFLTADEFVISWCGKGADKKAAEAKGTKLLTEKKSMHKLKDKNGDGAVDQNECVIFWSERFSATDANKDGKLSKEEFLKVMNHAAKRIDANQDGIITIDEYVTVWSGPEKATKPGKAKPDKK